MILMAFFGWFLAAILFVICLVLRDDFKKMNNIIQSNNTYISMLESERLRLLKRINDSHHELRISEDERKVLLNSFFMEIESYKQH